MSVVKQYKNCCYLTLLLFFPFPASTLGADKLEFNKDIRPILSNKCFSCHGPDNNLRKADLRLDQPDQLYKDLGGYKILAAGHPEKSELFARITSKTAAGRMPPKRSNKTLTEQEVALLRRWIEEGAEYQGHWAFLTAQRPALPEVQAKDWVRNPIDRFILRKLEQEKVKPSPMADRITLIRRLSFDLTGLPPTPAEVSDFLKDQSPKAYEKVVERLTRTQQFGERMAVYWLDVVRYADTGGYHSDNPRDVDLYRDYVINAFYQNKPFDDFLKEQLAGDLLANATDEQKIASGFNRLLQTTQEGGAQAKEYTAKYQADRVRNTGTIFLGLTMGCAECHDHKFDPLATKEFYQFGAFFADLEERAVGQQAQTSFPTKEQQEQLTQVQQEINQANNALYAKAKTLTDELQTWEKQVAEKKYQGIPKNIVNVLKIAADKRNAAQNNEIVRHFASVTEKLQAERQTVAKLQQRQKQINGSIRSTLISKSVNPRTVRVLPRGNWLDDSGEVVLPAVPTVIAPTMEANDKKRLTRLDLAEWMLHKNNPLVARVFVNRLWYLFHGQGIVKSLDDFGSQGTWPSHPQLLDWLAVEFIESGWDVRHMVELMVQSNTYRQQSTTREDLQKRDPYNQLFARQASYRLDAEMVRDNALAISGLLVKKVGGPSVKPYQPAGYWQHLNFPRRKWVADKGDDQYRRGLYTFWQRTFLHPSLAAFDAPSREECTVQRPRSNTPQQALVLLNDPTYVEAARVFAAEILRKGGPGFEDRLQYAFLKTVSRKATADEIALLNGLLTNHLRQYEADPKAAEEILQIGDTPMPQDLPRSELAAWTSVSRVLLNLHETITRR